MKHYCTTTQHFDSHSCSLCRLALIISQQCFLNLLQVAKEIDLSDGLYRWILDVLVNALQLSSPMDSPNLLHLNLLEWNILCSTLNGFRFDLHQRKSLCSCEILLFGRKQWHTNGVGSASFQLLLEDINNIMQIIMYNCNTRTKTLNRKS